jgi:hypothetical protein
MEQLKKLRQKATKARLKIYRLENVRESERSGKGER